MLNVGGGMCRVSRLPLGESQLGSRGLTLPLGHARRWTPARRTKRLPASGEHMTLRDLSANDVLEHDRTPDHHSTPAETE